MKKTFIFIMLLASFAGFSQAVTISTGYTPTQLVNDVLINSPCNAAIGTPVVKTGTSYGSNPNGVGYFANTSNNPNFPFESGVVLSTGDVTKIPGTNIANPNNSILSDGDATWLGDTDLENILQSQSGVTMHSVNASSLTFRFKPKTAAFGFDFIFASEAYGLYQCDISDAFAFILTEEGGGPTINLAVVPSTNIPVSVNTIRKHEFNINCPDANPSFFGRINGPGFGPAFDFNGQTVKMTASATLDPTKTYTIKIVIADGISTNNTTDYDSAIFIGAKSFTTGATLGQDYIAANAPARDAACPGALPTLALQTSTPLSPSTTYHWTYNNGTEFSPIQTGATLNLNTISPAITTKNTYKLEYTEPGCTAVSDEIVVDVYKGIGAVTPLDVYKSCDPTGLTNTVNISSTDSYIRSGGATGPALPATTSITYYTDAALTIQVANILNCPANHSEIITPTGKQIWVKIVNSAISSCPEIKSFFIKYIPEPLVNAVPATDPNITICARKIATDSPPKGEFKLNSLIPTILGAQLPTQYKVTYYLTQADANNGTGTPLTSAQMATYTTSTITIYPRVSNISDPTCGKGGAGIVLTVTPRAHVDKFPDKTICSTSGGHQLLGLTDLTAGYYTATNGGGTALNTTALQHITKTTKIFVYNNPGGGICDNESSFTITVIDMPLITPASATYCTSYNLPSLPYGFYVYNPALPPTGSNLVTNTNITATTTLSVYAESSVPTSDPDYCSEFKTFTITIKPFIPAKQADYPNQLGCSQYVLGTNLPNDPLVTYWTGANKTGTQLHAGDILSPTSTPVAIPNGTVIYVHKELAGTGAPTDPVCTDDLVSFKVYYGNGVIPTPGGTAHKVEDCAHYILPTLGIGNYYYTQLAVGNPTPPQVPYLTDITTPGTTRIWVSIPGETCTYNNYFDVVISLGSIAPIADVGPVCDFYELPANPHSGDYYDTPYDPVTQTLGHKVADNANTLHYGVSGAGVHHLYFMQKAATGNCYVEEAFDVTIESTPVLNSYAPAYDVPCNQGSFTLTPLTLPGTFYKLPGGPSTPGQVALTNVITPDVANVSSTKTVYLFQPSTTGLCNSESSIKINFLNMHVNAVSNIDNTSTCGNSVTLPAITGPGDYYDGTHASGGTPTKLNPGPDYTITNTTGDTMTKTYYIYGADTTGASPCTDEKSFTVTIYNKPVIDPVTDIERCDSYILPAYSSFTSTPANKVKHYYKLPGGPNTVGNTELLPGATVSTNTTLYVYADSGSASCFDEKAWNITIFVTPNIASEETALSTAAASPHCEGLFTLPTLTVGTYYEVATNLPLTNPTQPLTSTKNIYIKAISGNASTPCPKQSANYTITILPTPQLVASEVVDRDACNSYTLPTLTVGDYYTDSTHTTLLPSLTLTSTTDVYAYAATATTPTCSDEKMFTVKIYNVDEIADTTYCGTYTLPFLLASNAHYYALPNGAGPQITEVSGPPGVYNVFVYGTSPTGCHDEWPFKVTINEIPHAYVENVTALTTTICSTAGGFDLTTLNSTILGPQSATLYTVQYYPSAGDAAAGTHEILAPTTLTSPIHVKVTNNASPACFEPNRTVTIYIIQKPDPVIDPAKGAICIDPVTSIVTPAHLESGYPDTDYDFIWTDASGTVVSTAPNYDAKIPGVYTLTVVSPGISGCDSSPISITVFESAKPKSVTFTTSGWFTDNQTIDVTAVPYVGNGSNFLYALDGGTPQTDHIFTNVNSGAHEVTVYDANGCGSLPVPVPVQMINSPASFSPNGDNINDRWTIPGIGSDYAKLVIFDRYGRLIKETSPENGWDGTINGQALPADDYWFKIDYYENGIPKEYKSHFSLIR